MPAAELALPVRLDAAVGVTVLNTPSHLSEITSYVPLDAWIAALSVKNSSERGTDCPFLRSFVRCVCQGSPSYGGTNRDAS